MTVLQQFATTRELGGNSLGSSLALNILSSASDLSNSGPLSASSKTLALRDTQREPEMDLTSTK